MQWGGAKMQCLKPLLCLAFAHNILNAQTSNQCTCDTKNNQIICPSTISSETIKYTMNIAEAYLSGSNSSGANCTPDSTNSITITGGSLEISFTDVVKKLTTSSAINISGGTMKVNWDEEKKDKNNAQSGTITEIESIVSPNYNSGIFKLESNGGLTVSGGSFYSNVLVNTSTRNGGTDASISITGGDFTVRHLSNGTKSNNDNVKITLNNSGTLKVTAFENYGTANLSGGTSTISALSNYNKLNISGGTNTITILSNDGTTDIGTASPSSTATISNGTNDIATLANSGTLNISNGTNTITTFMNAKNGNITISGGTNNIKSSTDSTKATQSTSDKSDTSTKDDSKNDNANLTAQSYFINQGTLNISGGTNTIANFLNSGTTNISGGTNSFDVLDNRSKLTFGSTATTSNTNGTTSNIATITKQLSNYGTASVEVNQTLKLESTAEFYNYGTLSGSGKIEGGIFNHSGTFSNVKGEMFSNLDFNNFTNLTIKSNATSEKNVLDKLDVNNFGNNKKLVLEGGSLTTKGFENGIWADFIIKSGTLQINKGGKTTITCDSTSNATCCKNGTNSSNGKCEVDSTALNAAGFFTLESSGSVKSQIDFINSGYLTINGGTFEVSENATTTQGKNATTSPTSTTAPALKNQGGVIYLKNGTIKGNVENKGYFSMSGGTIENALTNHGDFTLSSGNIKSTTTNEGGVFTIRGGTFGDSTANTNGSTTFTNKVWEQNIDNGTSTTTQEKLYTAANLLVYGSTSIHSLKNESTTDSTKNKTYKSVISVYSGNLTIKDKLENNGIIYAYGGSINAEKILNNNNGELTAYKGSTIKAKEFDWGSGVVNFVNGNSGHLNFECVKISTNGTANTATCNNTATTTATTPTATANNSKLNMDFSLSPLVFGQDYYVIQTQSSPTNLDKITIESNAKNNLSDSAKNSLTFKAEYKNSYIVVNANISASNGKLESLLSQNALNNLQGLTEQLDSIKNIDSNAVLSHIISNPSKVANELKHNNESIATNHANSSHSNLATSLNTLNRLNKSSTPRKLAFSDVIRPTYNFANANKKAKNPLIRFANFNPQNAESIAESQGDFGDSNEGDSNDFEEVFTLQDLEQEYERELENAKLKYNQLIDYDNNLYASLFGIFGKFGGNAMNAYGITAGYDIKLNDSLILGANMSYANASKSHNLGFGGYGRAYIQNNEIDFGINFNVALSGYEYQFLDYKHDADFTSFGFNGNATYGYLFNVYRTQFFKPFAGINLYYANTPQYKENGKYARHFFTQHSFEMSLDLGAEYRVFLKKNYYLFAQLKFEQFIVNASNGLFMRFGDGAKFNLAQYSGYRNYIQALIGGDFSIIKDTFNITANVGYKMAILKAKIDSKEVDESFATVNVGVKYMF